MKVFPRSYVALQLSCTDNMSSCKRWHLLIYVHTITLHAYTSKRDSCVLDPPNDIMVRHADFREFYQCGEKRLMKNKQNTYFYNSLYCITAKCPNFTPAELDISVVRDKLLPVHHSFWNDCLVFILLNESNVV